MTTLGPSRLKRLLVSPRRDRYLFWLWFCPFYSENLHQQHYVSVYRVPDPQSRDPVQQTQHRTGDSLHSEENAQDHTRAGSQLLKSFPAPSRSSHPHRGTGTALKMGQKRQLRSNGGDDGLVTKSRLTLRPHRLQPARPLCLRDLPGENTGVGCHFLLHRSNALQEYTLR